MRKTTLPLLLLLLLFGSIRAQTILGMGGSGIIGLPDTARYGDTISGMQAWVVNHSSFSISGMNIGLMALPNLLGNPFQLGSINLGPLSVAPGDSILVNLDYFVVTPQNSNTGSNIMVVWPTAPGATPSDSTEQEYYVDGTTGIADGLAARQQAAAIYPNPSAGHPYLWVQSPQVTAADIVLLDATGRLVYQAQRQPMEVLDLHHLPSGFYLYHIRQGRKLLGSGRLLLQQP
jgi:hypothetical protein